MQQRQRATFDAAELAVVLSHYDTGVIESITELMRGSSRSAKVGIVAEAGKFVLKRRPAAHATPERVHFSHRVQRHLRAAGFPTPALISLRQGRREYLQIRKYVYELFEFIAGHPFRRTPEEAAAGGATLARFHLATKDFVFSSTGSTPSGDYHDRAGVRTGLHCIGSTLSSHESFSGDEAELATIVQYLMEAYDQAAEAVNHLGFHSWVERVVHGDWHPGNLLFRDRNVVGVIDYDSVRRTRVISDIANGALQFSMTAGDHPAAWPDHLDEDRFHAYLAAYESLGSMSADERGCIPHLMISALIAECVPPITETGSVGRWSGFRVLQMVRRKIRWLSAHGKRLIDATPAK